MKLAACSPEDAADLARVHAQAFERPWTAEEIAELLGAPGTFGLLASEDGPRGMILCRAAAGEAEVLTLAVAPSARRRGLGRALVEAAGRLAAQVAADTLFLEVAVDNVTAVALYEDLGFKAVGRRPGYYDRGAAGRTDALVLRRDLNTGRL